MLGACNTSGYTGDHVMPHVCNMLCMCHCVHVSYAVCNNVMIITIITTDTYCDKILVNFSLQPCTWSLYTVHDKAHMAQQEYSKFSRRPTLWKIVLKGLDNLYDSHT